MRVVWHSAPWWAVSRRVLGILIGAGVGGIAGAIGGEAAVNAIAQSLGLTPAAGGGVGSNGSAGSNGLAGRPSPGPSVTVTDPTTFQWGGASGPLSPGFYTFTNPTTQGYGNGGTSPYSGPGNATLINPTILSPPPGGAGSGGSGTPGGSPTQATAPTPTSPPVATPKLLGPVLGPNPAQSELNLYSVSDGQEVIYGSDGNAYVRPIGTVAPPDWAPGVSASPSPFRRHPHHYCHRAQADA